MIQPIIAMPPHHRERVDRLLDYCLKLDGTVIKVIDTGEMDRKYVPVFPDNKFASLQSYGLHIGSKAMKGESFIWVEPDSIPLKPGWAKILSDEYTRAGKHFLFSNDQDPPHDIVGGIGVYGPMTHCLVPYQYRSHGWDMFIYKHLKPLCAYTPLIQHTYGKYRPDGNVVLRRFPEDILVVRKDAVIFHKDHYQGLIECYEEGLLRES